MGWLALGEVMVLWCNVWAFTEQVMALRVENTAGRQ